MKVVWVAAATALLAGCVASPALIQAQTYDFGAAPTNAEDQIKRYFSRTLKDPMSATYEFSEPFKGRCDVDWLDPSSEFAIGWVVQTNVNAKNSYGGYTGAQPYAFFFAADQTMKKVVGGNKFGRGGSCRQL